MDQSLEEAVTALTASSIVSEANLVFLRNHHESSRSILFTPNYNRIIKENSSSNCGKFLNTLCRLMLRKEI